MFSGNANLRIDVFFKVSYVRVYKKVNQKSTVIFKFKILGTLKIVLFMITYHFFHKSENNSKARKIETVHLFFL